MIVRIFILFSFFFLKIDIKIKKYKDEVKVLAKFKVGQFFKFLNLEYL